MKKSQQIVIIGAGIGGLTSAVLLAHAGYKVTVLESQAYPGGCASTFTHGGYRFDAGATVAGGFQVGGPHQLLAQQVSIEWPVQAHDPAWVVHLPDRSIQLTRDNSGVLAQFPDTIAFWKHQSKIADLGWKLSAQGLPWPPTNTDELAQLMKVGLANFPADLRLLPLAFQTTHQWISRHGLHQNPAFVRFIDAQLLISAQATSREANAIYSATALDLARQGVYHVSGGIGGLADTLVAKIRTMGGDVLFRKRVQKIHIENGRAAGVSFTQGRRDKKPEFIPADFVIANLTPWSLDSLLAEASPKALRNEVAGRKAGFGAFALHVGIESSKLPTNLTADHHQIILDMDGPLGETRSLFVSMSPEWDSSRAPAGHRAVTITTHTHVQKWWDYLAKGHEVYSEQKRIYADKMLDGVNQVIPGFKDAVKLLLPGSPVTYEFYTQRHLGMAGGFPQRSLFTARSPRTGIANIRLVGDSIFPGQSTAGVTLGAMRVVRDVCRCLPAPQKGSIAAEDHSYATVLNEQVLR